jgi:pimeloyl-ACP methyl ester carboxylesterase
VKHPETHEAQAAAVERARTEWVVLDDDIREDFEVIGGLDRGDFGVTSRDRADENWLVAFTADQGGASYYAYDRKNKRGEHLFDARPDLFRCAVDIVGPSSLITLINSIPPYWKPLLATFHERVGNPDTEEDFLESRSPLFFVDRIRIPMLIAQGANDPRVKQAESEQIIAAMKEKGIDYEYLLFEDEGHGFARPENRLKFYAAAERFLAKHLGGRAQE